MLIAKAQSAARAQLLLDFEIPLFGVGILHAGIHCREVPQHASRNAGENIREHRRAGLGGRETKTQLAGATDVRCIAGGEQRIGESAQRDAIIEQTIAAAYDRAARSKRSPGKTGARRNVIEVGRDCLQELQIVAEPKIQGDARAYPPLILRIETEVRVSLRNYRISKRLGKTRVI